MVNHQFPYWDMTFSPVFPVFRHSKPLGNITLALWTGPIIFDNNKGDVENPQFTGHTGQFPISPIHLLLPYFTSIYIYISACICPAYILAINYPTVWRKFPWFIILFQLNGPFRVRCGPTEWQRMSVPNRCLIFPQIFSLTSKWFCDDSVNFKVFQWFQGTFKVHF